MLQMYLLLLMLGTFFNTAQTATIRLTRGSHPWQGYLEVYHNAKWGTVCDDSWSTINTQVACRQLGFSGEGTPTWKGHGAEYGLVIWLDDVQCTGQETGVEYCRHNTWGTNNCGNENVQITCKPNACQQHAIVCLNGGHCVSSRSSYKCQCPAGYTGTQCESDLNECKDGQNGGCSHQCNNFNMTGYNCSCPDAELELGPDLLTCYSPHAGVTCTSDGMSVSLSKTGLAGLRAEYLQVDGAGCPARDTLSHIVFNLPLNDCGTTRRAEGEDWVYENHITSRHVTVGGVVSPVRKLNVTVRCRYPQHVHVHQTYNVHSEQLTFQQDVNGQFPIKLDLEHGGHVYHSGSAALVADPGAPLSIHFSLDNSDPELEVFALNCLATPTPNATNPDTKYRIIQDGCVLDSTLQENRNGSEELLTLQAFKFVGHGNTVFLHCDVIICNASEPTSRCQQGCLRPSAKREEVEPFAFLEQKQVSIGPVHIRQHAKEEEDEDMKEVTGDTPTVSFGRTEELSLEFKN